MGENNKKNITKREQDILRFVAYGMTDVQIALKLEIGYSTLRHILDRLLLKLDANNRANLVYKAFKKNLFKE